MNNLWNHLGKKRLVILLLAGVSSLAYYGIGFKVISSYFPPVSLINGVQAYEVLVKGLELVTFALFVSPALFCVSLLISPAVHSLFKRVSSFLFDCSEKTFLVMIMMLTCVFTLCVATFLFHCNSTILIRDEIGYLFQAHNFAMGHVYHSAPPEALRKFFNSYHIVFDGAKVYGKYPFVQSAVLALGIMLGWVYFVPLIVSMCTICLNYMIAKDIYGNHIARISSLLCLTSPFFLGYSSTLIAEGTCLLFFSLFVLFFIKTIKRTKSIIYPIAAGVSLGLGFNTKPATVFALAIPFICYGIYVLLRNRIYSLRSIVVVMLSFGVMLCVFFAYNALLTSSPLLMPFSNYAPLDKIGFGAELGGAAKEWGPDPRGHSPFKGLKNSMYNLLLLNSWFGWCYPFLVPLVLWLFIAKRAHEWDWVFVGMIVSLVGLYFFYWFEGVSFAGPLYYFSALLPLTLLLAWSLDHLFERISKSLKTVVITFIILTYVILIPVMYLDSLGFAFRATKTAGQIWETIKNEDVHNALIFIEHREAPLCLGYAGFTPRLCHYLNQPCFNNDIVFAQDYGRDNAILMEAYPHRKYYIYDEYSGTLDEIKRNYYIRNR